MPTLPSDQPAFLIIVGPNGSGKSTAYQQSVVALAGRSRWINNSGAVPRPVREKRNTKLRIEDDAPVSLRTALNLA